MTNSVIILLSFNHINHTTNCLNSILTTFPDELVLLIHNGSSSSVVNELKEKYKEVQYNIKHLIIDQNQGYTGGVNSALSYVFNELKKDWAYFFTNDTIAINRPSQLPQIPGVYCPTIFRRKIGKIDSIGGNFTPLRKKIWHCSHRKDFFKKRIFTFNYFPGTAFLIHKDVYKDVGNFDETLHTYWEDVDYSMRCHKSGVVIGIIEDWQLLHKVGKTCHKDKFYTQHLFWKNRDTICKRYRFSFKLK